MHELNTRSVYLNHACVLGLSRKVTTVAGITYRGNIFKCYIYLYLILIYLCIGIKLCCSGSILYKIEKSGKDVTNVTRWLLILIFALFCIHDLVDILFWTVLMRVRERAWECLKGRPYTRWYREWSWATMITFKVNGRALKITDQGLQDLDCIILASVQYQKEALHKFKSQEPWWYLGSASKVTLCILQYSSNGKSLRIQPIKQVLKIWCFPFTHMVFCESGASAFGLKDRENMICIR